jgi:hypothetical protein
MQWSTIVPTARRLPIGSHLRLVLKSLWIASLAGCPATALFSVKEYLLGSTGDTIVMEEQQAETLPSCLADESQMSTPWTVTALNRWP